ncbi:FAD-binding dehydrogenase [Lapillicoccus sp.]|uniref:FAD-binding dehydrogenase n=1 Tax=Lapillicoccus sp. TaxID=1909287 RepID=UPI0025EF5083|nr:FAD-binding dehydrogenase [Lapillicoccus sp.]
MTDADAIVVGAGLAGLVAATELTARGRRVIVVEQESRANLGAQAFWSFGGLFMVDSPEQRRMGIKDSVELAWQDWQGTAGFDRPEDHWPGLWARAYVEFAAGEKRAWLHEQGMRWFPVVGWAERGDGRAGGHGNSVPRFHVTWGTGPGVVEPFLRKAIQAEQDGLLRFAFRHQVDELTVHDGTITGVRGTVLGTTTEPRGMTTNRDRVGDFALSAQAVVVTSGGIGGNHDLVRKTWPERLGRPPERMVTGVPAHVDGRMLSITQRAGASLINPDRMWHYVEGVHNWDPIWPGHAIRILPGPSSMWFDGNGDRLPPPYFPGFDTLGTLAHLRTTGHDHSWFVLTHKIIEKEFTLSGSEQNPDLTDRSVLQVLGRVRPGAPASVQAFLDRGEDFVQATTIGELVAKMNEITPDAPLDAAHLERQIADRDAQLDNEYSKDAQVTAIHGARTYRGDKLARVATPHKILDPKNGPLIAVRLSVVTRKTLGGLQTDLSSRVLAQDGTPLPGLYAAGEVAGFGGGGMHGYRSLEGTFLGGCIFSGRTAGRAAADAI